MPEPKIPDVVPTPATKGVQTLLGNPKKAIIKLSIPMIVAMSVHTLYSFVDGLWVAGLGPDALSAVGFTFPFFFMLMALSAGLGVGGSSAVSRMIGRKDKGGADAVAAVVALSLLTVLLAGLGPALALAGCGPIEILGKGRAQRRRPAARQVLVVLQLGPASS